MVSRRWQSKSIGPVRLQAGIPSRATPTHYERAHGLILRGCVTATYVVDDPQHPILARNPQEDTDAVAVYCDVLTYSAMQGQRFQMLKQVLVSQEIGGMHRGRAWKPRATTIDITDPSGGFDVDKAGANPANWDGDHVLVGFYDDNLNTPVILRGIPHPQADVGNSERVPGGRLKLTLVDGDPDFFKHHGSFYGLDEEGNHVVDTSWANDGSVDSVGNEGLPPSPAQTRGFQTSRIPEGAARIVEILDMSGVPASPPVVKVRATFDIDKWLVEFIATTMKLIVKGDKIELGADAAADKASLDSKIQTELGKIKTHLDALKTWADGHGHTDSLGAQTSPPSTGVGVPNLGPTPATVSATNSAIVTIDS